MLNADVNKQILNAASALKAGGTVAFPTETVYGLGADITNLAAIQKVYTIKQRPTDHPLIVHIADLAQLDLWTQNIPEAAWQLAKAFWPGPLTLILQRSERVPNSVTGGQDTVGIRVPNHPIALALLNQLGPNKALVAPSANRFGRISPTTAEHVLRELGQAPDMILNGGSCTVGLESTIVTFSDQHATILRPGGISLDALENRLNEPVTLNDHSPTIRAPGSHASHYAPNTPLTICSTAHTQRHLDSTSVQNQCIAILTWSISDKISPHSNKRKLHVPMPSNPIAYGQQLYATLHQLDHKGFDCIIVEAPPDDLAWLAISNRLQRASHH